MNLLFNQEKAIKKLSRYKVGALFMEAGTGKTLTACRLIESRKEIKKVLWFTPFRTKDNLKEELNKIGFEISTEIVGIESLSNSDTLYMSLIEKYKGELFFCVLDESLKIKNDSKRYKRITTIGEFAKYRTECFNPYSNGSSFFILFIADCIVLNMIVSILILMDLPFLSFRNGQDKKVTVLFQSLF